MNEAPRDVRRAIFAQERSERANGKWSPWRVVPGEEVARSMAATAVQFGGKIHGWLNDVHTVHTNGWLLVNVRTILGSAFGINIDHASFRTAMHAELTWKEKQRMKDELFGENRMAVEVYPRRQQLIDAADMYHLWVFPAGYLFDFGLGENQQ